MRKWYCTMLLTLLPAILFAGTVTVKLVGINPLTINIRGTSQDEEAGGISIYLYFRDDGVTDLITDNVDASQLETGFGWGTGFRNMAIESGTYNKGGHTFTRRLFYDNTGINSLDDYWTTAGINAIVCTFSTVGNGNVFVEVNGSDGLPNWGVPPPPAGHTVVYENQDSSLPVMLSSFQGESQSGYVLLIWTTESEIDNAGFHVYRSEAQFGDYERITSELIAGHGSSTTLREYRFTDRDVQKGKTYWYKLQQIDINGLTAMSDAVSVFVAEGLPDNFALEQNFPNPFNPSTTIQFALPESEVVSLAVYNLRGELLRTLVNSKMAAGDHRLEWDGINENGIPVPTGLYIYRMKAGNFTDVKKMLLTR